MVRPEANSPKVMDHDALRDYWAGRLYNHRWHSSREDMWALLMGRHERCGGDSLLRFLPSDGIAWKRIAGFACSPVSHVELASYPDPVTLAPDPRRGVVARDGGFDQCAVAMLRAAGDAEALRLLHTLNAPPAAPPPAGNCGSRR